MTPLNLISSADELGEPVKKPLPPLIVWTTHAADDERALLAAASLAS